MTSESLRKPVLICGKPLCKIFYIFFHRASQEKMEVLDQEDCKEKRSVHCIMNTTVSSFFSFMADHT